jgi:hypothetical protein
MARTATYGVRPSAFGLVRERPVPQAMRLATAAARSRAVGCDPVCLLLELVR